MMSPQESNKAVLQYGTDTDRTKLGHSSGPHEVAGRTSHFIAGMSSAAYGYQYGPPRSSHSGGNELSMREAQHMLTMPSDVFHSSISGGMPGWDTSHAGMPVTGL